MGNVDSDAIQALAGPASPLTTVYIWPLDERARDPQGRHGSFRTKCAVADNRVALISSANLTEYALNLNMELGIHIVGGEVLAQIVGHVDQLISDGILRAATQE